MDGTQIATVIAGFNCRFARLNQPLRFGNESFAAIAQALLIVGAANNSLACINDNHPELGLTLQNVDITLQTLNFGDLVAGFEGLILPTTLNHPNNYLTRADIGSSQYTLWYPGAFDPAIFEYTEVTKQPFGPSELLTTRTRNITTLDFKGPFLVVTCSMCINLLQVCVLLTTNRLKCFLMRWRLSCYWHF